MPDNELTDVIDLETLRPLTPEQIAQKQIIQQPTQQTADVQQELINGGDVIDLNTLEPVQPEQPQQQEEQLNPLIAAGKEISQDIIGTQENIINMAGALATDAASGIAGLAALIGSGFDLDSAVDAINSVKKAGIDLFAPKTEAGKNIQQSIGKGLEFVNDEAIKPALKTGARLNPLLSDEDRQRVINLIDKQGFDALAEFTAEKTSSPLLGTLVKTAPTVASLVLPASKTLATAKLKPLVEPNGSLSPLFEKELFKRGLSEDSLIDLAKADIKALNNVKGLTQAKAAKNAAEEVVKLQLERGNTSSGLAPIRLSRGKIVDDLAAIEAEKQGFDRGLIQLAKTANKQTKTEMRKALRTAYNAKLDESVLLRIRPSDFAGKALMDRIKFIRDKANTARKELNQIAKNELKGLEVDPRLINNEIERLFDELGIENTNPFGVPKPNFKGSEISGDLSSQRSIKEMIRIMSESKTADGLAWHNMKRQLDNLVNFGKERKRLGAKGEQAIKSMRAVLNDELRKLSPNYAKTNDILSSSLSAFEDLQKAVGPSIDLYSKSAETALGTKIRHLFSNMQKRGQLSDSFDAIDNLAKELGGNFKTDYRRLSAFTTGIEDVFGKAAKTSLAGEVKSAITPSPKELAKRKLQEAAEKGLEKLQNINDLEAFKSMDKVLSR